MMLRTAGVAGVAGVAVVAAALVWHHLPAPTDLYGPFGVHASAGQVARGDAITATLTSIRIAPQVNSAKAAGLWVVVDADLAAVNVTVLPHADLIVGPNTYTPSERFLTTSLGQSLAPGLVQRGSWAFDVAAPLVASGAAEPFTLRLWEGSEMLNSRLIISLPADEPRISRVHRIRLKPPVERAQ